MPVTDVQHDLDALTLTITADFAAPVERVWEVYADPRQLERVWGPPGYPATFVAHELVAGGRTTYYMTSPEAEKYYAYWTITDVEAPTRFTFNDGFALDETFAPNPEMPESSNVYSFAPAEDGTTRATFVATYASAEALQQVLSMGVVEGSTAAINQIDDLLAADAA
ncbi:SRPBCC domain-containing protein [Nocardioides sp. SYSU D00065]|uniref:SRPBCC family protein n=1 Tax=Nocardioides sp. SYSU D00065 TaxID=2817378 RepID=UPI001B33AA11|nr:SRPBCC domain-containing protein [Nocardioides sp. SYSU D00065]